MKSVYAILAAATVLAMATPSFADVVVKDDQLADVPRRDVHFADLNLDTQEGLDRLNSRIAMAVRSVCGTADIRSLHQFGIVRDCRQESLQRAFVDRDAILAARLAARGQPEKLAALATSIDVGTAK